MDEHLRHLERTASRTGDYTAFDAALAKAGFTRLLMRRLWLKLFEVKNMGIVCKLSVPSICVTNWSHHNHFTVPGEMVWYETDLRSLQRGSVLKAITRTARVLEIEYKTLIVPTEYLENPDEVSDGS